MTAALLRASLAGAVGVALAWCVCRLVPKLSPSARAWLWWCVALKFVVALVWAAPIALPVLPPSTTRMVLPVRPSIGAFWPAGTARTMTRPGNNGQRIVLYRALPSNNGLALASHQWPERLLPASVGAWLGRGWMKLAAIASSRTVRAVVLVAWIVGMFVVAAVVVRAWQRARAIASACAPASAETIALVADLSRRLSLDRAPDVGVSREATSPFVFGVRQPIVVLPGDDVRQLSPDAERMAICHELAHVKRRDVGLGAVPALAELAFFFHPFAKHAAREYAVARETACDAMVLETLDASPADYGRLLVDLGVTHPRLGWSVAAASWSSTILKRRLTGLGDSHAPSKASRVVAGLAIGLMLVMVVPMKLVARTVRSTPPPRAALFAVRTQQIRSILNAQLPRFAAPNVVSNASFDFLLLRDDEHLTWGRLGSVSEWLVPERGAPTSDRPPILADELASARTLKAAGQSLFWCAVGGHTYVIRDPQTIRDIDAIWTAPAAASATSTSSASHPRSLRAMTFRERIAHQHDVAERMQALNGATLTLTTMIQQGVADPRESRTSTIGPMLAAIGTAMQQAERPGESDVLRVLDRAWLKGLVEQVR